MAMSAEYTSVNICSSLPVLVTEIFWVWQKKQQQANNSYIVDTVSLLWVIDIRKPFFYRKA